MCPTGISGRDFELWQPLLSLAAVARIARAGGLLGLMQRHALAVIDAAKDDATPETDEILLKVLAEFVLRGEAPRAKEVLTEAQEQEKDTFPGKTWNPKRVANTLKRYGLTTNTLHGRKVYGRVSVADLRRVEMAYGLTLGLPGDDGEATCVGAGNVHPRIPKPTCTVADGGTGLLVASGGFR